MNRSANKRKPLGFFLAMLLLLTGSSAFGQCVSDGLEVPLCCTPATATLPTFPAISDSSKYVCFRNCDPQINANLCIDIDPPIPANSGGVICGLYIIRFRVRLCGSGQVLWKGNLRAQYSRNWQEIDASGNAIGVWRLLLNGDFRPSSFLLSSSSASNPCVIPPCAGSFGNRVYVAGYIDYALDCSSSTWTAAWAINHDCDSIHHPSGSPRPAPAGGFHPTRSYTWLGPGLTFVVDTATTPTASGIAGAEAVRWNDWTSLPNICTGEETVTTASVDFVRNFCPCNPVPGITAQYDETSIRFGGACGSAGFTLLPAIVPMLQKRIGSWTAPGTFPGVEALSITMGDMEYENGCTGILTTEFFEGVTTIGGFPATTYAGFVFERQAMDLGSANRNPANLIRRVGTPHVTHYLINLNLP